MKNLLALIIILCSTLASAQNLQDTTRKNMVGIDGTGLLKQFFNASTNSFYTYPYILTYNRFFGKNAIRLGVNGNFSTSQSTTDDTLKQHSSNSSFRFGLGFDRVNFLSRRFSFYYGMDLVAMYQGSDFYQQSTAISAFEQTNRRTSFGISPVLGIVFQLNNRISFASETSYDVLYQLEVDKNIYTPSSPYSHRSTGTVFFSQFNPPVSLFFRFSF